jgi:hypothetical protein
MVQVHSAEHRDDEDEMKRAYEITDVWEKRDARAGNEWDSGGLWVGKRVRALRCIYMLYVLLRMYGCQYDAWKGTVACY